MLSHIRITNFAIIEELDLELENGLTVITGETGAGKSIMIDAIGLVLGDRADANVVKHGADKAEISLTLSIEDKRVNQWLEEHDLDADGSCILRRIITAEGRSRSYINGSPVTLAVLRQIGEQMVDIHGQHAHQSLRNNASQRSLVDDYAHLSPQVNELHALYQHWKQAQTQYLTALEGDTERRDRIDLLRFQVNELNELGLQPKEIGQLAVELQQLGNADEINTACSHSLLKLYEADESSIHLELSLIQTQLAELSKSDKRFANASEMLDSAVIQIEEAVTELRELNQGIEANPARLHEIENRLGVLHDIARKHRLEPEQLPRKLETLQAELDTLEGPESDLDSLSDKVKANAEKFDALAAKVRKKRQQASKTLNKSITAAMQRLGMEGGIFEAAIEPLDAEKRQPYGTETVQFLVSANPGQPPQPLGKVASGGELSRIGLAIQMAASKQSLIPSLIFDEVDSGIGGAVAEVVGEHLQRLSENCQVFCVTHLPQVASFGIHHLKVAKSKSRQSTATEMTSVNADQRVNEIARMLGGKKLSDESLAHAREMLKNATP